MKKKQKLILALSAAAVLALGILIGIYIYEDRAADRGSGIVMDQRAVPSESTADAPVIHFPVYPDITITEDQKDIPIVLTNPKENPCYFQFILSTDDEKPFFTSGWIAPGNELDGVSMQRALKSGDHTLNIKIATKSTSDEKAMNGGNVPVALHVGA